MKKLNNKGITLIELIVSFAIVSVAMVYFYQTLYTVRKLYVTAQTETQAFVDKDYAIRIVNEYIDQKGTDGLDGVCTLYNLKYLKEDSCTGIDFDENNREIKVKIKWNSKTVSFYKKNKVVANEPSILAKGNSGGSNYTFFNGNVKKSKVRNIEFSSQNVPPEGITHWDASLNKNGSVIAWFEDSTGKLTIGGNGMVYLPKNSSYLFSNFDSLESINFNNVNTSNVEKMDHMFFHSSATKIENLSEFDTSKVNDMSFMFAFCKNLKDLIFGTNFKTINVKNMQSMFSSCSSLEKLTYNGFEENTLNFDTGQVEDMQNMFLSCIKLKKLKFNENLNIENVKTMKNMFYNMTELESIEFHNKLTAKNLTSMYGMFQNDSKLKNIYFGEKQNIIDIKTSDLLNEMRYMFYGCSHLEDIAFGNEFVTTNVKSMYGMFQKCTNLKQIDLSNFVYKTNRFVNYMFSECTSLETLDIRNWHFKYSSSSYYNSVFNEVPQGAVFYLKDSNSYRFVNDIRPGKCTSNICFDCSIQGKCN